MPTKLIDGGLKKKGDVTIGIDQSLTGFSLTVLSVSDPSQHLTWVYKSPYFGIERLVDIRQDRKSTRLNSSHSQQSRMPSSA